MAISKKNLKIPQTIEEIDLLLSELVKKQTEDFDNRRKIGNIIDQVLERRFEITNGNTTKSSTKKSKNA